MNIKTTLLTVLVIISISFLRGQTFIETDFVSGEVMVQLKNKTELPEILHKYNLTEKLIVSDRFNIYLLKFDEARYTNHTLINLLNTNEKVVNVQNNHNISLREVNDTIPNDALFNEQWSLLNTGQGGGTPGADIDATLAWDIVTGGVTALGDTIVVAIIDGGSDLNHEDLDFWKN